MIDFRTLVKAGVHFGHQTSRWMPKMQPYIWGVKNKVHLLDVSKTAHQLERAAQFLKGVATEGKQILWVGTKKPSRAIIQAVATKLDMPFVNHRWIGGTLSNFTQVKKSVTRLLHYEDVLEKSEKYPHYTKKELNEIQKNVDRLKGIVGGIRNLSWPLGAIVLVDVKKEHSALREAVTVDVPIIGLVDTNSDPSLVDYVIPANDDAPRSIKVLIDYLEKAVEAGKQAAKSAKAEKEVAKATKSEAGVEAVATEKIIIEDKPAPVKQSADVKTVADETAKKEKVTTTEATDKKEAKAEPKKKATAATKAEESVGAKVEKKTPAKKSTTTRKKTTTAKQQKAE